MLLSDLLSNVISVNVGAVISETGPKSKSVFGIGSKLKSVGRGISSISGTGVNVFCSLVTGVEMFG